jgi:hypothetical protein
MTPRLWALTLAPVLAASTAHAQAPGEVAPDSPPPPPPAAAPAPPPGAAPAPASPCGWASAPVPVMATRWAIGLSLGGMGVAPEGAPDGSEARFRVGELAVRYRASRRIELALAMSGGRQVLEDDTDGDLATGTVMLALRYRFLPEHRWNWFVTGGLGGTVVAPHESTKEERDAATRPLGMLGVGLERRFRHLALQAELRMVGLGQRKDATEAVPVVDGGPAPTMTTMPVPLAPAGTVTTYADQLNGGMFTLGASYYF